MKRLLIVAWAAAMLVPTSASASAPPITAKHVFTVKGSSAKLVDGRLVLRGVDARGGHLFHVRSGEHARSSVSRFMHYWKRLDDPYLNASYTSAGTRMSKRLHVRGAPRFDATHKRLTIPVTEKADIALQDPGLAIGHETVEPDVPRPVWGIATYPTHAAVTFDGMATTTQLTLTVSLDGGNSADAVVTPAHSSAGLSLFSADEDVDVHFIATWLPVEGNHGNFTGDVDWGTFAGRVGSSTLGGW